MLDELQFPEKIVRELQGRYMVYIKQPKPMVMQSHILTKEKGVLYPKTGSQHIDWRMKIDDELIGWSIVGGSVDNPITPERLLKESPKQFRGETKGRQPVVWLEMGKKREIIEVGVERGVMERFFKGQWMSGAQKVYYHEYFIKGGPFKDWTRIEVRAAKVPRLAPGKIPTPRKERVWLIRIPKDQKPYALGRGLKKKWKPPKGYIPFPEEWAKKHFPEDYAKWKEFMEAKQFELVAKEIDYTLALATWMGPRARGIAGRRMPRFNWYLLLDDRGKGSVRTFFIDGYPLKEKIMGAYEEERAHRKWLTYQGKTEPSTRFNPNIELVGDYTIIDKAKVRYESTYEDKTEVITMSFRGKVLKGKWELRQEEPETDVYTFQKLSEVSELARVRFVLDRHEVPYKSGKIHYDLRWEDNGKVSEFNLYLSPLDVGVEEPIKAIRKTCPDMSWLEVKEPDTVKKVGPIKTGVVTIDSGTLEVIEENPNFISFNIYGKKLKGIYIGRKENREWVFMKSQLPKALSLLDKYYKLLQKEGDPKTGKFYTPFRIEQKRGWDYFRVHLYDLREFTRIEPQVKNKQYLPELDVPSGVTLRLGLFRVPGKIHQVRVAYIRFDKEQWTYDKATNWIKQNKLHTWIHSMIREKKELVAEEIKIWFRLTYLDIPGREVTGYILTKEGTEEKVVFKVFSDDLTSEILDLYRLGVHLFYLRVWRGQVIQILDYLPEEIEYELS